MDIVLSSDDDDVNHPEYIEDTKTENKSVNKSAKKAVRTIKSKSTPKKLRGRPKSTKA